MQIFLLRMTAGFAVKINGPIPSLEKPNVEKRMFAGKNGMVEKFIAITYSSF